MFLPMHLACFVVLIMSDGNHKLQPFPGHICNIPTPSSSLNGMYSLILGAPSRYCSFCLLSAPGHLHL